MNVENSRGTGAAKQVLMRAIRIFKFLRDPQPSEEVFSITEWAKNDDDRRWVFVSFDESDRAVLAPVIALWFDIAFKAVLDLPDNKTLPRSKHRRVWFCLEEIAVLRQPISQLEPFTSRARSKGGCWIITTQDPAQLDILYSPEFARTIRQNCNNWMIFRANDAETAKAMSAQLGEFEAYEKSESISSGADDDDQDGSTYSSKREAIKLVMESELQTLPDNTGYLLMYGQFPVFQFFEAPFSTPKTIESVFTRADMYIDPSKSGRALSVTPIAAIPTPASQEADVSVVTEDEAQQEPINSCEGIEIEQPSEFQSDFASLDVNAAFGITQDKQ